MSKAVIKATRANVIRLLIKAGHAQSVGNTTGFLVQKLKHLGDPDAAYVMPFIAYAKQPLDLDTEMEHRERRASMVLAYEDVLCLRYQVRRKRNQVGYGYLIVTEKAECGTTEGTR